MRIAILGTGALAAALGARWTRHELVIAGRSREKADALAARLGAASAPIASAVAGADAVLLAVPWNAVDTVLDEAGPLEGVTVVDPTNAVSHGVGVTIRPMAARIAARLPGAHVVKAFHLFPAGRWADATGATVVLSGDDPPALARVSELVRDTGASPAVLGGLDRSGQLEEVAGFVIGLAFAGIDPASAVPQASSA